MKQGKRNAREWRFGVKAHVGTDRTGLVHTLVTTLTGAGDIIQLPQLLHGREREIYGGQAYWSEMNRLAAKERCGGTARCATGVRRRTRPGCSRYSRWPTCTLSGDDCCQHRGGFGEICRESQQN